MQVDIHAKVVRPQPILAASVTSDNTTLQSTQQQEVPRCTGSASMAISLILRGFAMMLVVCYHSAFAQIFLPAYKHAQAIVPSALKERANVIVQGKSVQGGIATVRQLISKYTNVQL